MTTSYNFKEYPPFFGGEDSSDKKKSYRVVALALPYKETIHRLLFEELRSYLSDETDIFQPKAEEFSPGRIVMSLILENGVLYSHVNGIDKNIVKRTVSNARKALRAMDSLFSPQKETLSKQEEQALVSTLSVAPEFVKFTQSELDSHRKKLRKIILGLTDEEKKEFIQKERKILPQTIQKYLEKFEDDEKFWEESLDDFQKMRFYAIELLLLKTNFFEACIDKKCDSVLQIFGDFFNQHPNAFYAFLARDNSYLKNKYKTTQSGFYSGRFYLLNDMGFARMVRTRISSDKWYAKDAKLPLLGLMANTFHRQSNRNDMVDFLERVERLPKDIVSDLSEYLFVFIKEMISSSKSVKEAEYQWFMDYVHHTAQFDNLFPLLANTKLPEFHKAIEKCIQESPASFCQKLLDRASTDSDAALFFSFLIKEDQRRQYALSLKTKDGRNLAWHLYDKNLLSKQEMTHLIIEAITTYRTDFLLEEKTSPLTADFPALGEIRSYFRHRPKALSFISSFKNSQMTPDVCFEWAKSFIPSSEKEMKLVSLFHMVPHWLRSGKTESVVSFLFNGDLTHQNLKPKFSVEQMNRLFTAPDSKGKTAWHYLFQQKERLFLGRLFKDIHPSLLSVLQQKDHDGKTPLDYLDDDLKFRKMLAERIPATRKAMLEKGFSLEYVPAVKESDPVTELQEKPVMTQEVKQPKLSEWRIEMWGRDKNRKDPDYIEAIQKKIDTFSKPEEVATRSLPAGQLLKKKKLQASTFKIYYNQKHWSVPFVHDDEKKVLYLFPGSDRDDTYGNRDYIRTVRNLLKWQQRIQKQEQYQRS